MDESYKIEGNKAIGSRYAQPATIEIKENKSGQYLYCEGSVACGWENQDFSISIDKDVLLQLMKNAGWIEK